MTVRWRTVYVFISSTSVDMRAEREYLAEVVFPALRERLERSRIRFVPVDLRWDATHAQADIDSLLMTCLREIDRCRPFFLGLLGGRYGPIPERLSPRLLARYPWIAEHGGCGVTELEFRYGALRDPPLPTTALFYLRDPGTTAAMVEEAPGEFRELPGTEGEQKLALLKREIAAVAHEPRIYRGRWDDERRRLVDLEEFGSLVQADLLQRIERHAEELPFEGPETEEHTDRRRDERRPGPMDATYREPASVPKLQAPDVTETVSAAEGMTCEEFYFRNVAVVETTPNDYRAFLEMLWRAHGEVIYKHAYARLGNSEDARDVCQDAFVRAIQYIQKHPDRIPVKVNFRGWLRLLVRNLIVDRFRRMMVHPEHAPTQVVETAPVEDEPEESMIRAEELAVLRKCIAALSPNARMLLTMCDLEGLSQKAAAEKIGSTPNAVGVALHRARKALRESVTEALTTGRQAPPGARRPEETETPLPPRHGGPAEGDLQPPETPATARSDENVQFTVYRPKAVHPRKWYLMPAFAHLCELPPDAQPDEADPIEEVQRQAKAVLGEKAEEYQNVTQDSPQAIPRSGEITFVPEIPGIEFNPPSRTFQWQESVHKEEFRLRASAELDGETARGRMSVFLGIRLLADVNLSIRVDSGYQPKPKTSPVEVSRSVPYRKIFASYSHKDVRVVEQFEAYAVGVGDRYLRDCRDLQAGQVWSKELEHLIDVADVFQLFWSHNSMHSPFVRQEWEYALALSRPGFVRPTYWEEPLPKSEEEGLPPDELEELQFQKVHCVGRERGQGMAPPPPPPGTGPPAAVPPPGGGGKKSAHPIRRRANIQPKLLVVSGQENDGPFFIDPGVDSLTIGQGPDNQICLPGPDVSPSHCRLYQQDGRWFVEDLGSVSGTRINGTPVTRAAEIDDVDRLELGSYTLQFLLEELPEPPRPTRPRRARNNVLPVPAHPLSPVQGEAVGAQPQPCAPASAAGPRGVGSFLTGRTGLMVVGGAVVLAVLVVLGVIVFSEGPPPKTEKVPKLTSDMVDVVVRNAIAMYAVLQHGDAKPGEMTLKAGQELSVKIDERSHPFRVVEDLKVKLAWTDVVPEVTSDLAGLSLKALRKTPVGTGSFEQDDVLDRKPDGWHITRAKK